VSHRPDAAALGLDFKAAMAWVERVVTQALAVPASYVLTPPAIALPKPPTKAARRAARNRAERRAEKREAARRERAERRIRKWSKKKGR
jgi:hypothetical protein